MSYALEYTPDLTQVEDSSGNIATPGNPVVPYRFTWSPSYTYNTLDADGIDWVLSGFGAPSIPGSYDVSAAKLSEFQSNGISLLAAGAYLPGASFVAVACVALTKFEGEVKTIVRDSGGDLIGQSFGASVLVSKEQYGGQDIDFGSGFFDTGGNLVAEFLPNAATIPAAQTAPVASPATLSTEYETALVIDLNQYISDANPSDVLTCTLDTDATNGGVVITDNVATYTPNATYEGADSFVYQVSDGTDTDTATISITVNENPAVTGSLAITAKRSYTQIGPEGVMFTATASGLDAAATADPVRAVEYEWDFSTLTGDYAAPENILAGHAAKSVAGGQQVGKVFPPGSHTVNCTAKDRSGGTATDTFIFTVKDPDVEIPVGDIHIVSQTSNFGAEPGSQHTSLTSAIAAVTSNGRLAEIRLRAGETFDVTATQSIWGSSRPGFRLTAFGAGARPKMTCDGLSFLFWFNEFDSTDVVIDGIEFAGAYDPLTETGPHTDTAIYMASGNHYTLHDLHFSGFGTDTRPLFEDEDGRLFIHDCSFDGAAKYSFLGGISAAISTGVFSIRGNRIRHNPDALQGGDGAYGDGRGNDQGSIRISKVPVLDFGQNEYYATWGWSRTSGGAPAPQGLRLSAVEDDDQINFDRCAFENGATIVDYKNTAATNAAAKLVIDKCIFVGTCHTERPLTLQNVGTTVRNSMFILPDTGRIGQPVRGFVYAYGHFGDAGLLAVEDEFYHNTIIDLRSTTNNAGTVPDLIYYDDRTNLAASRNITAENNIVYAPNRTSPITADGPFVAGGIQMTGPDGLITSNFYKGVYFKVPAGGGSVEVPDQSGDTFAEGVTVSLPALANPSDVFKQYIPDTGSAAISDATTGLRAQYDLFGNLRVAGDDERGAIRLDAS